jgi:hypothetical protein
MAGSEQVLSEFSPTHSDRTFIGLSDIPIGMLKYWIFEILYYILIVLQATRPEKICTTGN